MLLWSLKIINHIYGIPTVPNGPKRHILKVNLKFGWILNLIFLSRQYYTLNLDDQINPLMFIIDLKHDVEQIVLGNRISVALATYIQHSNYDASSEFYSPFIYFLFG